MPLRSQLSRELPDGLTGMLDISGRGSTEVPLPPGTDPELAAEDTGYRVVFVVSAPTYSPRVGPAVTDPCWSGEELPGAPVIAGAPVLAPTELLPLNTPAS